MTSSKLNFSSLTPAPPPGAVTVHWQADKLPVSNLSAYLVNTDAAQQKTFQNPKDNVSIIEDFMGGGPAAGFGASSVGILGQMGWLVQTGTSPSALVLVDDVANGGRGAAHFVAGNEANLFLPVCGVGFLNCAAVTLDLIFRMRAPGFGNLSSAIGLTDLPAIGAPSNGIYFGMSSGTGSCKTQWAGHTNNTGGPNLASVVTDGLYHIYEIKSTVPGTVSYYLDGSLLTSYSSFVPTVPLGLNFGFETGAGTEDYYIDYVYFNAQATR